MLTISENSKKKSQPKLSKTWKSHKLNFNIRQSISTTVIKHYIFILNFLLLFVHKKWRWDRFYYSFNWQKRFMLNIEEILSLKAFFMVINSYIFYVPQKESFYHFSVCGGLKMNKRRKFSHKLHNKTSMYTCIRKYIFKIKKMEKNQLSSSSASSTTMNIHMMKAEETTEKWQKSVSVCRRKV